MGVLDWFNQAGKSIAGAVSNGVNWISQNITQPAYNFAKNVPIIGDVVRGLGPLGSVIKGVGDSAGQYSRGQKVTSMPTLGQVGNSLKTAGQGIATGIGKGAAVYGNLQTGNLRGALQAAM